MYLPNGSGIGGDEDVARVHVGMEKAVAEHLREEDLDAGAGEPRNVDALGLQTLDLADGNARHALHHHDLGTTPVPVDLGDEQQRRMQKIAAQLRAVGRFAPKVELVVNRLVELGDDLLRLQAFAVRPQLLDQPGAHLHEGQILLDGRRDVRPQHLDRGRRAVG